MPDRTCEMCPADIPPGSRISRRFCSQTCSHRSWKKRNAEYVAARQLAYQRAHAADRTERRRAEINATLRVCLACSEPLPLTSKSHRKFCSRKCINVNANRVRRLQRQAGAERYRRRKLSAPGRGVSPEDWLRLQRRFGGRCAYCGVLAKLTKDHVVPLTRGGQDAIGNILPACLSCNSRKRSRLLVEFRRLQRLALV